MTYRGRILDGVIVITDTYQPDDVVFLSRRPRFRHLFFAAAIIAIATGALIALSIN